MLDLENIDDLGICSGFVAHLPTTDVYFTGVGRYSPLTNDAVLRTAHEYLLYRDVRFIITPMDLLLKANAHRVPERLLNNAFERIAVDAWGQNAIYRRTDASAASYRPDRSAFSENVAHTTHIVRASIDGSPLSAAEIGPRLGMLRENTAVFSFNGRLQLDLTLADHDEDLHGLYVARLAASSPGLLSVTIINERGEQLLHDTIALAAGQQTILREFPPGTRGTSVRLELVSPDTNRVTLTDMRITGQSHALHLYLRRTLHFPGF
jgi:hypothetical protein